MSKYYYHGVGYDCLGISNVFKILRTGGIKCRRLLGLREFGYNGVDYISVCKKYAEEDYKQTTMDEAFYSCIQDNFCFIISDRVEAIKTKPANGLRPASYSDVLLPNKQERISDLFDEWQVYQEIPLSMIVGIGIPSSFTSVITDLSLLDSESVRKFRQVLVLANELGLDIVDTSKEGFVEEYEKEKETSSAKIYQISKQFEEAIANE